MTTGTNIYMPKEQVRALNKLWSEFYIRKQEIMLEEFQRKFDKEENFDEPIYIEEFQEHWRVQAVLKEYKKLEYEIYEKYNGNSIIRNNLFD